MTVAAAPGPPELRPLGVGETLDLSIRVYTRHAGTFLRITAALIVPLQVVAALVFSSVVPDAAIFRPPFQGTGAPGDLLTGPYLLGALAVSMLQGIVVLVAVAACFKAAGEAYLGGRAEWREALRFGARRVASLVWLAVIVSAAFLLNILLAAIAAGLVAAPFAVVGPIGAVIAVVLAVLVFVAALAPLTVYWSVAVPALLAEGALAPQALGRSLLLVRGRWWATAGVVGLTLLLTTLVQIIVAGLPLAVLFTDAGDSVVVGAVVNAVATGAASIVTVPLLACAVSILYFDLRVRKEGLDLQLAARGMAGQEARGTAPPAPVAGPLA